MLDGIFSPAFLQEAGRAGKPQLTQIIRFTTTTKDPTFTAVSCNGLMTVASIVDGQKHIEYYKDLDNAALNVSADADTEVVIKGENLTNKVWSFPSDVSSIVVINAMILLSCADNTDLQTLDISKSLVLLTLLCSGCTGLKTIYVRSDSSSTATAVADAITAADAADGTVYTNADGDYYTTIETAATTKGWTIKPLA